MNVQRNKVLTETQHNKYFYLLCFYIILLHLCAMLGMINLLPGGKPAFIVDIATLIPILLSMQHWDISAAKIEVTYLDFAVMAYLVISILSIVLYLQPNNPSDIVAYFYGFHYFVLPIFLYFAVKSLNSYYQYKLLQLIFYFNTLAVVIGITLLIWRPDFYYQYVEKNFSSIGSNLEEWQLFGRLQSYLGSTALGSVIAATIVLFTILNLPKKILAIFLPILLLGTLLTSQRGCFIASLIAVLYTFFNFKIPSLYKFLLAVISLLFLTICLNFYVQIDKGSSNRLLSKYSVSSIYASISSDQRGYGQGLLYFEDFPMGVGLGATSSVTDSMGLAKRGQVVDANFMRILADLGILGLFSFFFIILTAACAALKREHGFGWLLLYGVIIVICIGTNTLDSYYVSHLFWLFLGIIDTKVI
jgi:hypothetical protein